MVERIVRRTAVALALVAAVVPVARAQEAAPQLQEDPRAAKYRDVERGFFVGLEAGYLSFLETPTANPAAFPYAGASGGSAGGVLVGLNAGVDVGSRVALSVYAQGGNERANVNYGAFSVYGVGGDVRVSVLGLKDRNAFERFFVYLHARAGYARTWPTGLFGHTDVLVAAGPGIEYYTRLRHFSVGLATDYVRATKAKANGFAIYPTLRYTF